MMGANRTKPRVAHKKTEVCLVLEDLSCMPSFYFKKSLNGQLST
jgi:hypothetical protein